MQTESGFRKITVKTTRQVGLENSLLVDKNKKQKLMAKRRKKQKGRKFILSIFLTIFILIAISIGIGMPVLATYNSARETEQQARLLVQALKNQDLEITQKELKKTKIKLAETKSKARVLSWTGFIPFVGAYYRDFDHGMKAAEAGLQALEISIESVEPYADLLGLKGEGKFTAGSADERIQTAVVTFEKITPRLAEISEQMEIVQKEIAAIDPNRYPERLGERKIREPLRQMKEIVEELSSLFVSARPLLEELPKIMGYPEPRKYLVFFKNDKELRPDGGFITAYAIFSIDSGKLLVEKADDIYKLDESKTKEVAAPPEILKYHKNVYKFHLRDSNLSPDFVESIKLFEDLYNSVANKVDYDGIISIDTHVLVESMKILGSFVVYGRTFSAENDSRCDCPKVIYELEDYATRPVAYIRETRKDIIGVLLHQIMQKALGVSPSQYWGRLFQMGINELNEKHILVYLKNEKAQKAIEQLNWGGRIKDFSGDYLHVNDANMAGAKSDLFVVRSAKIDYQRSSDGKITKTLVLDYKNPAPPSNCNLEAGELCLNGLLRNWVRIYVPKGSQLVDFIGSEMDVVVKEDLEKTVFEGFLTVKPLGASQIIVKYTLPDGLLKGDKLPVLIQKQPGTEGHQYEITVNGKTIDKFELRTDRELEIKI